MIQVNKRKLMAYNTDVPSHDTFCIELVDLWLKLYLKIVR